MSARYNRAHFAGVFAAQEARSSMRAGDQSFAASARERFTGTACREREQIHAVPQRATPDSTASGRATVAAGSPPIYALVSYCRAAGLPEPTPEFRFHPTRKWRADYAWPFTTPRVIVEIDGGVWSQGRHTRGAGFIEDQRKTNAAQLLGFVVLRYTPDRLAECVNDLRVLFAKEAA